jgi:hypothetical protein
MAGHDTGRVGYRPQWQACHPNQSQLLSAFQRLSHARNDLGEPVRSIFSTNTAQGSPISYVNARSKPAPNCANQTVHTIGVTHSTRGRTVPSLAGSGQVVPGSVGPAAWRVATASTSARELPHVVHGDCPVELRLPLQCWLKTALEGSESAASACNPALSLFPKAEREMNGCYFGRTEPTFRMVMVHPELLAFQP